MSTKVNMNKFHIKFYFLAPDMNDLYHLTNGIPL